MPSILQHATPLKLLVSLVYTREQAEGSERLGVIKHKLAGVSSDKEEKLQKRGLQEDRGLGRGAGAWELGWGAELAEHGREGEMAVSHPSEQSRAPGLLQDSAPVRSNNQSHGKPYKYARFLQNCQVQTSNPKSVCRKESLKTN